MSKHIIKEIIVEMLREQEGILMNAFMQFDRFREYAFGDQMMTHKDYPNWVFMIDVNLSCAHAFNELLDAGIIILESVLLPVALAGGDFYKLPLADPRKKHRSQHWMPMIALKGPNFPEE